MSYFAKCLAGTAWIACVLEGPARADLQTFQIQGFLSNFTAPSSAPSNSISAGDTFTGFFRYDPTQPGYSRHPGDPAVAYNVSTASGPFLSISVQGQEFDIYATYLNVYFHGAGVSYDKISTYYDGFDRVQADTPWGTFSGGGANQVEFTLENPSGSALSSAALPTEYNIADWPIHFINLYSLSGSSPTAGLWLNAQITSISDVPEPRGNSLFLFAAGSCLAHRLYSSRSRTRLTTQLRPPI